MSIGCNFVHFVLGGGIRNTLPRCRRHFVFVSSVSGRGRRGAVDLRSCVGWWGLPRTIEASGGYGLLGDAFEEVSGLGRWLRDGGGGEGVVLGVAVLGEDEGAGALHEGGLGGVGSHGLEAEGEDGGYVEGVGPGCGDVAEAAFDEEVGGEVVEALRRVEHRREWGSAWGSRPSGRPRWLRGRRWCGRGGC